MKRKNQSFKKYYTLTDQFSLNEDLILDRTLFDEALIQESKEFLSFLDDQEHPSYSKNKPKYIAQMESFKYNNLYELLENVFSDFQQSEEEQKYFIKKLREFYQDRNGFFTIDMFAPSEEYDIPMQLEQLLLEKNISLISLEEDIVLFLSYLESNFQEFLRKENGEQVFLYH